MPPRVRVEYSNHFLSERRRFVKNNPRRFRDYQKSATLFIANPSHSGLKTEKLRNTKGVYTFRLNKSDRVFFIWKKENRAIFIDIGKHDKYRKY